MRNTLVFETKNKCPGFRTTAKLVLLFFEFVDCPRTTIAFWDKMIVVRTCFRDTTNIQLSNGQELSFKCAFWILKTSDLTRIFKV